MSEGGRCPIFERPARPPALVPTCSEGATVISQSPAATLCKHPGEARRASTPSALPVAAAAATAAAAAAVVLWTGATTVAAAATDGPLHAAGPACVACHWWAKKGRYKQK